MVDVDQLSAWLVVAAFFVLLPFLLIGPNRPRHALAVRLERLGAWALPRLQARAQGDGDDPGVDPEFAEEQRREQAYADLSRLRHLVETDASMSATRQLANRIAYERLQAQVDGLGAPAPVRVGAVLPTVRTVTTRETLDVDWRH